MLPVQVQAGGTFFLCPSGSIRVLAWLLQP